VIDHVLLSARLLFAPKSPLRKKFDKIYISQRLFESVSGSKEAFNMCLLILKISASAPLKRAIVICITVLGAQAKRFF
jgi:hypothetical protein